MSLEKGLWAAARAATASQAEDEEMAIVPTTYERKWPSVILTPISIANHIVTVSDTRHLHTKQKIILSKPGLDQLELEIKRVLSDTQLHVGLIDKDIGSYTNPVDYNGGTLIAEEQERNKFGSEIVLRAVYQEEPAVALRTLLVDRYGAYFTPDNPLPVQLSDGQINIGTVNAELEVQLSSKDNFFHPGDVHDSVRIGDQNYEAILNPDGSLNTNTYEKMLALLVNANFLKLGNYDQVLPVYSGDTATLSYYESGAKIAQVKARFVDRTNWDLKLEAYINNDDGEILTDDNNNPLFLE